MNARCPVTPCLFTLAPQIDIDIDSIVEEDAGIATQPTRQLLVRLPEELARRLRRQVPMRGRSAFVQRLLEQALAPEGGEDDPLYQAALAVEQDEGLAAEMAEWDGTISDGLDVEAASARHG